MKREEILNKVLELVEDELSEEAIEEIKDYSKEDLELLLEDLKDIVDSDEETEEQNDEKNPEIIAGWLACQEEEIRQKRLYEEEMPELSEEGYSKFQSQMERHRNFMTTFRADASWSSLYAIQENVFMSIADDKDQTKSEGVYKMLKKEKELLDTFMYAMNTGLTFNKGNIDINGKATISEPETGRPIYIGEGLIPQIEAAANKYCYSNKPNLQLFNMIMSDMADKAQSDTGNKFIFIVNRKMWNDLQMTLGEYLANYQTDGTYMYSKSANKGLGGYVKVGATFDTYEYAGNQVSFIVDRALTREYPTKGYGVCIDLTADKTSGTPAIAKFSLTGKDFMTNKIVGVGGYDGKSSGEVASNVAGSKLVMMGYAGVAAFTPYRSVIVREA